MNRGSRSFVDKRSLGDRHDERELAKQYERRFARADDAGRVALLQAIQAAGLTTLATKLQRTIRAASSTTSTMKLTD